MYEHIDDTEIVRKRLDQGKKVVAFSCVSHKTSKINAEGYQYLAELLVENGFEVLFLINPDHRNIVIEALSTFRHIYSVNVNNYYLMDFIDILFVQDVLVKWRFKNIIFPENTRVISSDHALMIDGQRHWVSTYFAITANSDYHIISQKEKMDFFKTDFEKEYDLSKIFPREITARYSVPFAFIPAAYPRFDNYVHYINKRKREPDSILILLHTFSKPWEIKFVNKYLEAIIQSLINNFPDYNVLLRPDPLDVNREEYLTIKSQFESVERFIYDDKDTLKEDYSRGVCLITGTSNASETFALSTLRPRIRCHFERSTEVKELKKDLEKDERGYIAYNMEQFNQAITEVMRDLEGWQNSIKNYINFKTFQPGSFSKYMMENINYILEDKPHPDWFYIERDKFLSLKDWKLEDYKCALKGIERKIKEKDYFSAYIYSIIHEGISYFPNDANITLQFLRYYYDFWDEYPRSVLFKFLTIFFRNPLTVIFNHKDVLAYILKNFPLIFLKSFSIRLKRLILRI